MAHRGKTRIVRAGDGRRPARNPSYVDIEQIKKRYGGRAAPAEEAAGGENHGGEKVRYSERELDVLGQGRKDGKDYRGLALGLCAAALAGALIGLYFLLIIDKIEVRGNVSLEKPEVLTIAGINRGEHILFADVDGARRALINEPYIRDAQVKRIYPDKLVITIEERVPVAAIKGGSSSAVIDMEGFVMEITDSEPEGLISVYGMSSSGFTAGRGLGEYSKFNSEILLEILKALSDQGIMDIIESIDMSQPLKIGMNTVYGYYVNIGQPENIAEKLDKLGPVLNKVMEMGKEGGTLDLGVLGDPVYAPPETYAPEPGIPDGALPPSPSPVPGNEGDDGADGGR